MAASSASTRSPGELISSLLTKTAPGTPIAVAPAAAPGETRDEDDAEVRGEVVQHEGEFGAVGSAAEIDVGQQGIGVELAELPAAPPQRRRRP